MTTVASFLERQDAVLRSGGAPGSDWAFQRGVHDINCGAIIYRPEDATEDAVKVAAKIHPAWHLCNDYAKKLHARNVQQVLGLHLDKPSEFVVCWTPGSKDIGGTCTAIVCAREHGVPVYNLADPGFRLRFEHERLLCYDEPFYHPPKVF
jgi:hypothetical protein